MVKDPVKIWLSFPHLEADAPYCFNMVLSRDFPKLPTQIAHMDLQGTLHAVRCILTEPVQKERSSKDWLARAGRFHWE